jgi:5-(carboxyamino)imidazole ribonucleotide synthase
MKVGVLGAGQLGRMLALAGYPLGLKFLFLDPTPDAPAGQVAEQIVAPWDDPKALDALAHTDVVSYEFESVPDIAARTLAERVPVWPPPASLAVAQDRLREKEAFRELGIATAPFAAVDSEAELARAVSEIGTPAVLKTRRLGYDGKGQYVLRSAADVPKAWAAIGGVPLLLEGFVSFSRELSVLGVRGQDGRTAFYPLVENEHERGILRISRAPAPSTEPKLQARAETMSRSLLEYLGHVGVLALELFDVNGELYANEIAPRVHNSGHWTIEGARTSQFENHLRAISGLPLGDTSALGPAAMVNLLGEVPSPARLLALPDVHLHDYGKQPRPDRKVGHVTLRAPDFATLDARIADVQALLAAKNT